MFWEKQAAFHCTTMRYFTEFDQEKIADGSEIDRVAISGATAGTVANAAVITCNNNNFNCSTFATCLSPQRHPQQLYARSSYSTSLWDLIRIMLPTSLGSLPHHCSKIRPAQARRVEAASPIDFGSSATPSAWRTRRLEQE